MENNKFLSSAHRGVVMIWSLVAVSVITIIIGALGSHYSGVARIARIYQNQTGVNFAAWRGLDEQVHQYLAKINKSGQSKDIAAAFFGGEATTYKDAQGNSYDVSYEVTKGTQKITQENIANALNQLINGEKAEFEVTLTATKTSGGLPATTKMREVVEVEKRMEKSGGLETMKVFNYVYFANNYGHLDGSVVANGEIGGNDKFTINGARVNGYIDVRGASSNDTSAVILQNSPKMWPYYYYMKRVVENDESDFAVSLPGYTTSGKDYYTSVRPTDPIYISTTSNIVWTGGYEPPGVTSKYGDVDSSGQFVGIPVNPYAEEVSKYVGDNPYATEYKNYYNNDNSKKTNPHQTEYDKYFNADGSDKKHEYQDAYLTYYNANGTAKANPVTAESDFSTYLDANGSKKTYPNQSQIDSLASEWSVYFSSEANYNSGEAKDCPYKNNKAQRDLYNAWQSGLNEWKKSGVWYGLSKCRSDGSKRTSYNNYIADRNTWTNKQTDKKTRYDAWNNAKNTFDNSGKKTTYEKWCSDRDAWKSSDDGLQQYLAWKTSQESVKPLYDKWNSDKSTASANFTEWQRSFEDWLNNLKTGGNEVDLTWETAHLSVSNNVKESKRIINVTTNIVDVPNMSDGTKMQEVIDHCKTNQLTSGRIGGWLRCWNRYRMDSGAEADIAITNLYKYHREYYRTGFFADLAKYKDIEPVQHTGLTRTLGTILVEKGDGSSVEPFKNDDSAFADTKNLVKGSAILIGTEAYPIEIDGPVYFPGDVVIRGFVKGKGTIYAGRNIHIVGDITYKNPPSWPHKNMSAPANHPQTVALRNKECDVLMLVSRGNIIVGDYSSDIWQSNANMQYLKSYGQTSSACNDFCESDIGYPKSFARDYTQNDGGKKVNAYIKKTTRTGDDWIWAYNVLGKWSYGYYGWTEDKYELKVEQANRKYYESLFGESVISGVKQVATADPTEGWKQSSSLLQRIRALLFGTYVTSSQVSNSKSPAAGDITEINAALISNHGIFGVVGGQGMPQFTLNGAMICRDEGLLPSFTSRFSGYTQRKIWLNWDLRLRSSSAEGVLYGALMHYVENTTVPQYIITIKSTSVIQ